MRVEVDFRLEDLDELYVPEVYAADPSRYRRKMRIGVIGWIVCVALLAAMYLFSGYTRSRSNVSQVENPPRDFQLDVITLALPGILAILLTSAVVFRLWRGSKWRAKKPSPSAAKKVSVQARLVAVILTMIVVAVAVVAFTPELASDWRPSRGQIILVCWTPWLLVLLVFVGLAPLMIHWQARRMWLNNPAWARHHTYEFDDWGLKASDPTGRFEKSWVTFTRARETANLLVLVHESSLMYIIPKRAFPTEADIEAARALLQNRIENTTFLAKPLGFPMTPRPVEPLPPILDAPPPAGDHPPVTTEEYS
jgi:NADH:ubiquinone oxidoreductase subunit 5 (subunit L)/multisubunit Na+/H+ antiporter MnhA subunit